MTPMRPPRPAGAALRPAALAAAMPLAALALVALLLAACGPATPSALSSGSPVPSIGAVASPTPVPTGPASGDPPASGEPPEPTRVPGGQTVAPEPAKTRVATTQTD